MSRGFFRAALASTMAALVAMSPCAASRGGSAVMAEKSSSGRQFAGRLHGPQRGLDLADEMAVGVHGARGIAQSGRFVT